MKIRQGFVSNSSSSSFVISVTPKNDLEKESELLFKFFMNAISKSGQYTDTYSHLPNNFDGTVDSYIELLRFEQEDLEKDIEWAEKEIDLLKSISKNEDAANLFECWYKLHGNNKYSLRLARQSEESATKYGWNTEGLKHEISPIEQKIKRKKGEINDIEERVEKLLSLPADSKIIAVNIDNMDEQRDNLNKILNSSWITIIEEIHR